MIFFRRVVRRIIKYTIDCVAYIHPSNYSMLMTRYLRSLGCQIEGDFRYIHPSAQIDSYDWKAIQIGKGVTISQEVMLLTHDFSSTNGAVSLGQVITPGRGEFYEVRPIKIGSNCFIGARAFLLPGTVLGENCIVGAGAVVRGQFERNSVLVGNPAIVVGDTISWAKKRSASTTKRIVQS